MSKLGSEITSVEVPVGAVRIWWLGQAGFAFKTHAGKVVLIDPYLSDAVERLAGFKRLSLPPIEIDEVRADLVILTHEHEDHLDPDALPVIARGNPTCRFAAPSGCTKGLEQAGVAADRRVQLEAGRQFDLGFVTVHAVAADHGDYSLSALSLVLDFDGVRILCAGDTSLRPETLKPLYNLRPDVVLPCINGVFGNMNHIDAALMVQQANPRITIPCHYWMFAEQGGDPGAFLHACKYFCPEVQAMVLKPGEGLDVERRRP